MFLVASFSTTAVLVYEVLEGPLSKLRNVFFGHLLSVLIGVMAYILFGNVWYFVVLAVVLVIMATVPIKIIHLLEDATALACVYGAYSIHKRYCG